MYSKEILKKSPGLVLLSKGVSDYKQHVVFVVIHKNLNKLFLFFSWKTTRGLQTETPLVSKIKGKFLQFFVAFLTNLNFKYVLHTKWEKKVQDAYSNKMIVICTTKFNRNFSAKVVNDLVRHNMNWIFERFFWQESIQKKISVMN